MNSVKLLVVYLPVYLILVWTILPKAPVRPKGGDNIRLFPVVEKASLAVTATTCQEVIGHVSRGHMTRIPWGRTHGYITSDGNSSVGFPLESQR